MNAKIAVMMLVGFYSAVLNGQDGDVPKSAKAEILRRGNLVTQHGTGKSGIEDMLSAAYGPPADDSGKWFITVVSMQNCKFCTQLLADWRRSPELLAFADPAEPKRSWAHFNVYRSDDPTQRWRFKNLKLDGFPVILVQPPRSRQFGDPATVVMQATGYDGDAKKLAAKMSEAIRQYVGRVYSSINANRDGHADGHGDPATSYQPPFTVPKPDEVPATPFPFQIPPGPQPATLDQLKAACQGADSEFLLAQLEAKATVESAQQAWRMTQSSQSQQAVSMTSGGSALALALASINVAGLIAFGLTIVRQLRKSQGQPMLLNDAQFADLQKFLAESFKKN